MYIHNGYNETTVGFTHIFDRYNLLISFICGSLVIRAIFEDESTLDLY